MKAKIQKKKIIVAIAILLGSLTLICCSITSRIAGSNVPAPRVLSKSENICVAFASSSGTGEHLCIFTYRCDSIANEATPYDDVYLKKEYLDLSATIECPVFSFEDENNDLIDEIYIKQDRICKWFAHDDNEPREQVFEVDKDGKFLSEGVYRQCS